MPWYVVRACDALLKAKYTHLCSSSRSSSRSSSSSFCSSSSFPPTNPHLCPAHTLYTHTLHYTHTQPTGLSRYQRTKALHWKERLGVVSPLLSSCEPLLALRRQLAGLIKDAGGMGACWLQHAKLCRATGVCVGDGAVGAAIIAHKPVVSTGGRLQ